MEEAADGLLLAQLVVDAHGVLRLQDVHRDTASRLFGVEPAEVTDRQRGQAKTVNFGVLYGQGPYGLARTLGITTQEASAFIDQYRAAEEAEADAGAESPVL